MQRVRLFNVTLLGIYIADLRYTAGSLRLGVTKRSAVTKLEMLLSEINYSRTELLEYANEDNIYKGPQNKGN